MDTAQRLSPFLEQVRAAIRVRHYSIRTKESYLFWVWRFILFHGKRHPRDLGEREVAQFLGRPPDLKKGARIEYFERCPTKQ